jgi:hypothetical protein
MTDIQLHAYAKLVTYINPYVRHDEYTPLTATKTNLWLYLQCPKEARVLN